LETTRRIEKLSEDKFIHDTKTVLKFIQLYCDEKHKEDEKNDGIEHLNYQNKDLHVDVEYHLCQACQETFTYSYQRLQECPHEQKPSCRKCPNPCYEKPRWKHLASIMRFSGMKLGLLKIRRLFLK